MRFVALMALSLHHTLICHCGLTSLTNVICLAPAGIWVYNPNLLWFPQCPLWGGSEKLWTHPTRDHFLKDIFWSRLNLSHQLKKKKNTTLPKLVTNSLRRLRVTWLFTSPLWTLVFFACKMRIIIENWGFGCGLKEIHVTPQLSARNIVNSQ